MEKKSNIFKAYDIRGLYPDEVNEEMAFKVGQGFIKFLKEKQKKSKFKIVVGQDNRISSPALFKHLSKGITQAGSDVVNIGLSTTPMFYFAVAFYGFDGGIMITSSHNPPEYNGFKLVRENAIPISGKTGLKKIEKFVFEKELRASKKGRIIKKKVLQDYVRFNLKGIDTRAFSSLRIVIDTANSVSGIIIPSIFKKFPFKIFHLFKELDGTFPNHNPDPLKKENLRFLKKELIRRKGDLGVAFDGDGDRIVFLTEKAKIVSGDIITALVSDILLRGRPKEKVIYDVRSSNIVKETIEKNRGIPLANRIGHSFIKERMRRENILFAGEFSGHYYSREHYFCECPFYVLFLILKEMSKAHKPLSQLIKSFQKYFHSGEINFKVKDKKKVLAVLEKEFGRKGEISKIDGIKISFKDWWFNLRPSNTEPLVRLVLEAKTKNLLEKHKKRLLSLIEKSDK